MTEVRNRSRGQALVWSDSLPGPGRGANSPHCKGSGLTVRGAVLNIPRLMSAEVPELLDAWRMAAARRSFDGRLPLAAMARLRDLLADTEGEARFTLEFGHDALQVPFAELRVDVELPLICQRSLSVSAAVWWRSGSRWCVASMATRKMSKPRCCRTMKCSTVRRRHVAARNWSR